MNHAPRRPLAMFACLLITALLAPHALADGGIELPPIDLGGDLPDVPAPGSNTPTGPDAPDASAPQDTASGWQLRFYQLNWRRIASSYAELDGNFVVVPTYDRSMANSLGMRTEQWIADKTKSERVSLGGGLTQRKTSAPARAEALAYTTRLPSLDIGSYGHFDSAHIDKIVSDREMIVSAVWLLDKEKVERERESDKKLAARNAERWIAQQVSAERERLEDRINRSYRSNNRNDRDYDRNRNRNRDYKAEIERALVSYRNKLVTDQRKKIEDGLEKRFAERDKMLEEQAKMAGTKIRLIGFPTARLQEGKRWSGSGSLGPQVAIINDPGNQPEPSSRSRYSSKSKVPQNVTAIDADLLRVGLTEDRFKALLKERGLTVESFAELAQPIMKQTEGFAKTEIVNAIEGFGQLSGTAPKRPTPKPTPEAKPTETEPEPKPAPDPDPTPAPGGDIDIPLPDFDLFENPS